MLQAKGCLRVCLERLHAPACTVVLADSSPAVQFFFVPAFWSQSSEKCQRTPNIPGKTDRGRVLKEGGKLWEENYDFRHIRENTGLISDNACSSSFS